MANKWKNEFRQGNVCGCSVKVPVFRIISIHHYIGCGDKWFMSVPCLFDCKKLMSKTIESAKAEAVAILMLEISKLTAGVSEIADEIVDSKVEPCVVEHYMSKLEEILEEIEKLI